MIALISNYFLSKRSIRASTCFNAVGTIFATLGLIEKATLRLQVDDLNEALPRLVIQIASLALLGSNQAVLLVTYLICQVYIAAKEYYIQDLETFQKHVVFFLIIFIKSLHLQAKRVVSHNEEIIFKNKQVSKTFDLTHQLIERRADYEEQKSRETSAASALEN